MKTVIIVALLVAFCITSVFAAERLLRFDTPLLKPNRATLGETQKIEILQANIEELRNKIQTVASYAGYSSPTGVVTTLRNYTSLSYAR